MSLSHCERGSGYSPGHIPPGHFPVPDNFLPLILCRTFPLPPPPSAGLQPLTFAKLIEVDRLGSRVPVSASFQIFALTAGRNVLLREGKCPGGGTVGGGYDLTYPVDHLCQLASISAQSFTKISRSQVW